MPEALIIDAVRTPRGIGKVGKGALADHPSAAPGRDGPEGAGRAQQPQHRRGRRHHLGHLQPSAASRAATSAAWRRSTPATTCAPRGVTLDRFCGSGITAVNLAAAQIMSGMEDLVIAGGTEMMSYTASSAPPRDPDAGPMLMDSGNLRLRAQHPQSHQGVCADAIATLEGITREALDELALVSQQRADDAIRNGHFDKSPGAGLPRGRLARPRPRGVPAPADHAGGPRRAEAVLRGHGRRAARRQGHDLRAA